MGNAALSNAAELVLLPNSRKPTDNDAALQRIEKKLDEMAAGHDVLTVPMAAKLLGISTKTLRNRMSMESIPHRKVGRRTLFFRQALLQWLQLQHPKCGPKASLSRQDIPAAFFDKAERFLNGRDKG